MSLSHVFYVTDSAGMHYPLTLEIVFVQTLFIWDDANVIIDNHRPSFVSNEEV